MPATLPADPAVLPTIAMPLSVTILVAVLALVAVAVYVRRLRTSARLTVINGGLSAIGATLVLATALLISVSLGNVSAATAATTAGPASIAPAAATLPITDDLDGFQLPTR
jgi:hypothetical protein